MIHLHRNIQRIHWKVSILALKYVVFSNEIKVTESLYITGLNVCQIQQSYVQNWAQDYISIYIQINIMCRNSKCTLRTLNKTVSGGYQQFANDTQLVGIFNTIYCIQYTHCMFTNSTSMDMSNIHVNML